MEFRDFEKRDGDDWVPVEFEDLKPGDRFRAFEHGKIVAEFTVAGYPKPHGTKGDGYIKVIKGNDP